MKCEYRDIALNTILFSKCPICALVEVPTPALPRLVLFDWGSFGNGFLSNQSYLSVMLKLLFPFVECTLFHPKNFTHVFVFAAIFSIAQNP